jgi:FkbM family methyltransferase
VSGSQVCGHNPTTSLFAQLVRILDLNCINVICDIGANEGQFAKEVRDNGYRGKIISFEPLSSAREKLIKLANQDDNWSVYDQCAIGDYDGEIDINIAGNSVSSSVLPMLDAHAAAAVGSVYVATERTPLIRLDSVADQYLVSASRLFIKIDAQGFEWQVLDGAAETLKRAQGSNSQYGNSAGIWRNF